MSRRRPRSAPFVFARWSHDGREVLFLAEGGREVRSMPAAGGEPRVLVDLAALDRP